MVCIVRLADSASGPYCRAFGPPGKGQVQKVAGVERSSAQRAHLQVQLCADRATVLLHTRATPQLTRLSGFQDRTSASAVIVGQTTRTHTKTNHITLTFCLSVCLFLSFSHTYIHTYIHYMYTCIYICIYVCIYIYIYIYDI
jgi:hypothetical protein